MFSGFDFKRFSLDALQDEENEEQTPAPPLPVVPERAERLERTRTPPPQKLPPTDTETSEWDWDQDTAAPAETTGVVKVGAPEQRFEETDSQRAGTLEGNRSSLAIPTASMPVSVGATFPAKPEQKDVQSNPDTGELGVTGPENGVAEERRDVFQEASKAPAVTPEEGVLANEMVRVPTGVPLELGGICKYFYTRVTDTSALRTAAAAAAAASST